MKNQYISKFKKFGYVKINLANKGKTDLTKVKKKIQLTAFKLLKKKKFSLEKFHYLKVDNIELNNFRTKLMQSINKDINLKKIIYEQLKNFIDECVGPDIIVQKFQNLVIQQPKDKNRAPFHKDAPVNSNYEIVVWLPLVDCFKSMSMYMFDIKIHEKVRKFIINNSDEKKIESFCKKNGKLMNVRFGEVLIFLTNNYHYIPINEEDNTRWSFNIRYKNLFTPYGTKNLMDFYEIFKLSPTTKLINSIEKI